MKLQNIGRRLAIVSAAMILSVTAAATVWAKTKLDTVSEVYWNEDEDNESKRTEAVWEAVEDANQYEIALYRDESRVTSVKVKGTKTSYNFKRKMDVEGDYTFRVRALAKDKSKEYSDGSWSDYSDGLYISAARAEYNKTGKEADTSKEGPGMPKGSDTADTSSSGNQAASGSQQSSGNPDSEGAAAPAAEGQWIQDANGWWYRRADGTYPANNWFMDPASGKYYMFDSQGYMKTGWIDWENNRYYCDEKGTPSGAMVTGTYIIDGLEYQFDASGAMIDEDILSGGSSSSEED